MAQTDVRHIHINIHKDSGHVHHVSVGLAQARPTSDANTHHAPLIQQKIQFLATTILRLQQLMTAIVHLLQNKISCASEGSVNNESS